jgi:hypothetical protein
LEEKFHFSGGNMLRGSLADRLRSYKAVGDKF